MQRGQILLDPVSIGFFIRSQFTYNQKSKILMIYFWIILLHFQVNIHNLQLYQNDLKMEHDPQQSHTYPDLQRKYGGNIGSGLKEQVQLVTILKKESYNYQLRNDILNIQQKSAKPNTIPINSAGNNIVFSERTEGTGQKITNEDRNTEDIQKLESKDELFTSQLDKNYISDAIISEDKVENANLYQLASNIIDAVRNAIGRSSTNHAVDEKQIKLQNGIGQFDANNEDITSQSKAQFELTENIKIRRHISKDKKLFFILSMLSFGGGCALLIKVTKLHQKRYCKEAKGVQVPQEELYVQQI